MIDEKTIAEIEKLKKLDLVELKEMFKINFEESVKKLLKKESAIMFSGGVDSTLISFFAKKYSNVKLITIGTKESQDRSFAREISKELGLEWIDEEITEEKLIIHVKETQNILKNYLINKENKLMEIELGTALLFCVKIAKNNKTNNLFNGQGSEELFGGYERHLNIFKQDVNSAEKFLLQELMDLPKTNLERNNLIANKYGINLACPFLDMDVIKSAMAIPVKYKMNIEGEKKIILHEIAKEIGIPKLAYERPKKAAQYGSGIHKMMTKLIKNNEIII